MNDGVTRARKTLYLLYAGQRMLYGRTQFSIPSRFLKELPPMATKDLSVKRTAYTNYTNTRQTGWPYREFAPRVLEKPKPATPTSERFPFECGDRIYHKTFGNGTLTAKTPMGSDLLLEIRFDRAGTKKIMANYAKLTKAEE